MDLMTPAVPASGNKKMTRSPTEKQGLEKEAFIGWKEIEDCLDSGGLWRAWDELLAKDSVASFYQTPLWCVTWYRHYQNEFEPCLLVAKHDERLVGLAALARERSSGRVLFAGDSMADYRDFVCADGFRREVIELFLPQIIAESTNGVFVVGQTQPESQTVELVQQWAAHHKKRFGTITRSHPCWRFRLGSSEEIMDIYKKKTLRQAVAYYKRRGELRLKRICECGEWDRLKDTFFQQQLLRQASAERTVSFADQKKQTFYGQLFGSKSPEIHFSGLWVADNPISFMFSFAYRGVLYYGAPSFDLLEQKHSPGLVHILEVLRQCQAEGYREVDLTLGSSSFKGRIGNHCVMLPSVYVYGSRSAFWLSRLKKMVLESMKTLLRKVSGSEIAWELIKRRYSWLQWLWQRVSETPTPQLLSLALFRLRQMFFYRYVGEVFRLRPDELIPVEPRLLAGETCEFRKNRLEDYLTLQGKERRDISVLVQMASKRIAEGHTLHTVMVDGRLTQYGWSYRPQVPAWIPETETLLNFEDGAISLFRFETVEAYRGQRLYQANLAYILKEAFGNGAKIAYIINEKQNRCSQKEILGVGFKHWSTHYMTRVLWWKRRHITLVDA